MSTTLINDNIIVQIEEPEDIVFELSEGDNTIVEMAESLIVVEVVEESSDIIVIDAEPIIVDHSVEELIIEVDNGSITIIKGSSGGYIFPLSVSSSGIVGNKVYIPGTVPPNTVVSECTTDSNIVTVSFLAEGGKNYSPTVTVDGIECSNLQQISNDLRLFRGSVDVPVPSSKSIILQSSTGESSSVFVTLAENGPSILSCKIDSIPTGQVDVKENDQILISGKTESGGTSVQILDYGISSQVSAWEPITNGEFSFYITVGSRTGVQGLKLHAKNSFGTVGDVFISPATLVLDQNFPIITDEGTIFPIGQRAFKGTESGKQKTLVSDFTSIGYSSPGDFTINSPTEYSEEKIITCTNPGNYNDSQANFKIIAHKSTNGSFSTFEKVIEVADTAPIVVISQPHERLRSSPTGASYAIQAVSNQNLMSPPDINIPVDGTWQGSSFSGGPKIFNRNITILDSNTKGSGAWEFLSPVTNNAGISATIQGTQILGGFQPRDIILEAFQNEISVDVEVVNYSKLKTGMWEFSGQSLLLSSVINDSPPVPGYFTINATGINPHIMRVLDTNKTLSSSQATIIHDYEEMI